MKKKNAIILMATTLIGGLLSWSVYDLLNKLISDILGFFGIQNEYIQDLIIILVGIAILYIIFKSFKKVWKVMFE